MLSHLYRLWQIAFCKPVQQQKCRRCRFDVRSFNSSHDCCVLFCFRQSVVCKSLPAPNKLHTVRVYEMRSEREEMHKNLNPSLKAALHHLKCRHHLWRCVSSRGAGGHAPSIVSWCSWWFVWPIWSIPWDLWSSFRELVKHTNTSHFFQSI